MSQDKMSRRERFRQQKNQKQLRNRLLIGVGLILVALIAVGVWRSVIPSGVNKSSPDVAGNLSNTDSALNVGTRIGQPAPTFTLSDAKGAAYNFQPSAGHKYVLAFNMGYV